MHRGHDDAMLSPFGNVPHVTDHTDKIELKHGMHRSSARPGGYRLLRVCVCIAGIPIVAEQNNSGVGICQAHVALDSLNLACCGWSVQTDIMLKRIQCGPCIVFLQDHYRGLHPARVHRMEQSLVQFPLDTSLQNLEGRHSVWDDMMWSSLSCA